MQRISREFPDYPQFPPRRDVYERKEREVAVVRDELHPRAVRRRVAHLAGEEPIGEPTAERGYRKLFLQQVMQADKGADFEFLRPAQMLGKVPKG